MSMVRKPATTVTKVCRILREFQYGNSFGIKDIAERTDLLPSDVHRILTSFRSNGYVEQDPDTKRYRLGLAFLRVGLLACRNHEFRRKARPLLSRLCEQIEATVYLAVYDVRELELFIIDQIEDKATNNAFRGHIGAPERLHCTALGKAILANLDRVSMTRAIEKTGMKRFTGQTITDIALLQKELEQIRRVGYSMDRGEYVEGIWCLATPVHDYSGNLVGAFSTSMPAKQLQTWDEGELARRLKTVALQYR